MTLFYTVIFGTLALLTLAHGIAGGSRGCVDSLAVGNGREKLITPDL